MIKLQMYKIIKFSFLLIISFFFLSCRSYLWHVQHNYLSLLFKQVSIESALENPELTEAQKNKLKIISKIKRTAQLKWKRNVDEDIYSSYVHLDRPYLTYLLRVSDKYALKAYTWSFLVAGRVPYLGFFDKEKAYQYASTFSVEKYDTYTRGVRAFSTLGWFNDPITSSMLVGSESDFVLTIFHELAHSVLFFKGHINFNERFAEFIGRKSTELFYKDREGSEEILKNLQLSWKDELLFSEFMSREITLLEQWYKENQNNINPERKAHRLKEIQQRFVQNIQPQLQASTYNHFTKRTLNNAILLSYRSYNYRMDEFERLYNLSGQEISVFIDYCESLKKAKQPEKALSELILSLSSKG